MQTLVVHNLPEKKNLLYFINLKSAQSVAILTLLSKQPIHLGSPENIHTFHISNTFADFENHMHDISLGICSSCITFWPIYVGLIALHSKINL